jgi:hypothetical protein
VEALRQRQDGRKRRVGDRTRRGNRARKKQEDSQGVMMGRERQ